MLFERHDQNWSDVFAELYLVGFILLGCHLSGCRRILHAYTHSEGIWHSVGAREASLTRSLSDPSEYILWSLESVCPWIALDLSLFVLEGSLSIQGQTDSRDQRMYSEGSERERVSEASRAPTLCHMPFECVYACRMRRHPDRWHPKRMNPTRYSSAKTSLQFWSCRSKSIPKLKWHCHFRRGFLQFRHAKPQGTVDESPIQCKEQSQQCNDVRTSTLF